MYDYLNIMKSLSLCTFFFFNIIWPVLCSTSNSRETFWKYLVYIQSWIRIGVIFECIW
ncbi:unnamed protein product [Acanthoscelides obtectus]|uniref:Uncharacterized protein n=1 Tax=Acanthoscelides obtectus TaxID=200917 RepID=A0A9P0PBW3_ACAOB|nr:unnamed protein product [Acanthoscelides obtectus]CAK1665413.1 hypothetical protein AOBTE_LOCUS24800 [Acanthoscelides obtectus]